MLPQIACIKQSVELLGCLRFKSRHRRSDSDFTRSRILDFHSVAVLMLTKGTKSVQLCLNEFIPKLNKMVPTVSRTAYAKARAKFSHTAFIELNKVAVVETFYASDQVQKYKGLRILAVDGSKIILPTTDETAEEFGTFRHHNQMAEGQYCSGLASVLYDVLNGICLDATLERGDAYECALVAKHLSHVSVGDLVIFDRGYCTYSTMAVFADSPADFLIRCRRNSFSAVNKMFEPKSPHDMLVDVKMPEKTHDIDREGLPDTIRIRLVRVELDNGEIEVLATSLTDSKAFPAESFKSLYWMRWGVETLYDLLKNRLVLENFSINSVEGIKQDFYSTIFLTGIEAILVAPSNGALADRDTLHLQRVNKAVSFNTVKNHAFELFCSGAPVAEIFEGMTQLFIRNADSKRDNRSSPRNSSSLRQKYNSSKRTKKSTF